MHVKQFKTQLRRFKKSESGAVLVEFAFALPIFMAFSVTALETVHFAVTNMRLSMIAMTVADNMSRAKQSMPNGSLPQLREVDVNDTLLGARIQAGETMPLLTQGRIIVSSLQRNAAGKQWIAWQRCKGMLDRASLYGNQGATEPNSGSGGFQGMGTGATRVRVEPNNAVNFVEIVYTYRPIFGQWAIGSRELRKEAAFYVRDERDLTGGDASNGIYNPSPGVVASSCNVRNSTF